VVSLLKNMDSPNKLNSLLMTLLPKKVFLLFTANYWHITGSPGIREANKSTKEQPTKNVNQVIQNKVSPRKSVPAHTFTNGSDNSKQAFGKKPFEDSNSSPFYHTEPNNFTPGLGVSNSAARLQDLCPEDKQKIGELIKKLASEKDEKEKLRRELEQRENHYKGLINNLAKENEDVVKDSLDLQSQFRYSLNLLKSFQVKKEKVNMILNNLY